ncbi:unnamed protein product [Meloidogyne enterolobii]|uniref:Uncharacterized protein n=1 Tax=Meloidogyne enterolobii TaxID=390850 RepID=A0ACB0YY33_MELEN
MSKDLNDYELEYRSTIQPRATHTTQSRQSTTTTSGGGGGGAQNYFSCLFLHYFYFKYSSPSSFSI